MWLKLSPISRTNKMSHLWWQMILNWTGCFQKHKSVPLRRHQQSRNTQTTVKLFLCSANAELIFQKSIPHLSPRACWPTLTQEPRGNIRASWPTFTAKCTNLGPSLNQALFKQHKFPSDYRGNQSEDKCVCKLWKCFCQEISCSRHLGTKGFYCVCKKLCRFFTSHGKYSVAFILMHNSGTGSLKMQWLSHAFTLYFQSKV